MRVDRREQQAMQTMQRLKHNLQDWVSQTTLRKRALPTWRLTKHMPNHHSFH
jgi:hypothetical protein